LAIKYIWVFIDCGPVVCALLTTNEILMRWLLVQGHANAGTTWRISNPPNCYENAISQMETPDEFTESASTSKDWP